MSLITGCPLIAVSLEDRFTAKALSHFKGYFQGQNYPIWANISEMVLVHDMGYEQCLFEIHIQSLVIFQIILWHLILDEI